MFGLFKKNIKNHNSIGVAKYTQLKKLLKNEEVFMTVMVEGSHTPISIAIEVATANEIINYLSALTGLSSMDVITCGSSTAREQREERYDERIISMIIEKEEK